MLVARKMRRNCIGIEIVPEYIEMTKCRVLWGSDLGNIEWKFVKLSPNSTSSSPQECDFIRRNIRLKKVTKDLFSFVGGGEDKINKK
jgi:hypothetical protein